MFGGIARATAAPGGLGVPRPGPIRGAVSVCGVERHYEDDGFEFDRLLLLGGCRRRLADAGEILVAFGGGDHEAWVREFSALVDRVRLQVAPLLAGP